MRVVQHKNRQKYQWVNRLIKNYTNIYLKLTPCYYLDNFVIFLVIWPWDYYMINLIKITKQYIIWEYTTDRHILIIVISLLQERWRWHCYSHPTKLCLSAYHDTFDYSTLKAHISKPTNDRNKQISDSESKHPEGTIV